jgi:hypothetical protein
LKCLEIKNQWARDDPAFVVLLIYFIFAASLAYSIAFGVSRLESDKNE